MRQPALYSSSTASRPAGPGSTAAVDTPDIQPTTPQNTLRAAATDPRWLWVAMGALALGLLLVLALSTNPGGGRKLTQNDIDAAVLKTLETANLPSPATRAYEAVLPSVVRVVGYDTGKNGEEGDQQSVGTGVVIVDTGVILTNLHVVRGVQHIKVVFADGLESAASISGVQPENDLAVLRAHKIPDDLQAATMRSTARLAPGDPVMAVGFPFDIGPSASTGVVSGLKRTFRSPQGKQAMSNLIQFDAAANPGNSGGPLVTMDGEVVGIVTAILNPTEQHTFIGIGFAVPIENAATAAGMPPF